MPATASPSLVRQPADARLRPSLVRAASIEDDAEIRALLSAVPLEGRIAFGFRYDPSYFDALQHLGVRSDVVVASRADSQTPGALGARTVWEGNCGSQRVRVGYLHSLRVHPTCRPAGGAIVAGLKQLREARRPDELEFDLLSLTGADSAAERLLVSGHRGLPHSCQLESLTTFVGSPRTTRASDQEITTESISARDWLEITSRAQGEMRKDESVLRIEAPRRLSDIPPDQIEFLVLRKRDAIVASAALWDQRPMRQIVLSTNHPMARAARRPLNSWRRLRRHVPIPRSGAALSAGYIVGLNMVDESPAVLRAMANALRHSMVSLKLEGVMVTIPDAHPLRSRVAEMISAECLSSTLYAASWSAEALKELPTRVDVEGALL